MREITHRGLTCNDRVLEKAKELAEDIYWGEERSGDKDLLDMLIDFLDSDECPDDDWEFICFVNEGNTCESLDDEGGYGYGREIYGRIYDVI